MQSVIIPNRGLINLSTILILMMFLSFLKIVNIEYLNILGDFLLLSSLVVIFLVVLINYKVFLIVDKKLFFSLLPIFIISLIYFINVFVTVNPLVSLQRSILIFFIAFAICFFYKIGLIDYKGILKNKLYYLLLMVLILILSSYFVNPGFSSYQSFFLNPNAFGMYATLLFLSLIYLSGKNVKPLIFFLGLFFIFISSSRSSLLAYLSSLFFIIFGSYFYSHRRLYVSIITFFIILAVAIVYFMAYLDLTNYNELFRMYSGKNLLSGRNEVWPFVLNLTQQHPYFGWGGGVSLDDVSSFKFSSHNFYLHTALQIGYFSVLLIFIFYILFWLFIWKGKGNKDIYYANGLFIYLILIQNFEVTLLQNNLAMSVPVFCLISYIVGVNSSNREGSKL